jgi:sulfate adenylyltransferase subunit 2
MVVGQNKEALAAGRTFPATQHLPDGHPDKVDRQHCCAALKTGALQGTLQGTMPRMRLDLATGRYELDPDREPYHGVIVGARADEEGSRSKERYFSPRTVKSQWNVGDQPPEFWNQFNTDFPPGTHVRIHPLLDWTELNVWEYIEREQIPTVSLYYDHGEGMRYRSLGCGPCTLPVASDARTVGEIIVELRSGRYANIAERSGRAQDKDDGGGLETLRREGYM